MRLKLHADINRLQFERAIAPEGDTTAGAALEREQAELAALHAQIAPLQMEMNRLSAILGQEAKVAANKYDLSASRYRQVERDEMYYEVPEVTIERLVQLDEVMRREHEALEESLA